MNPQKTSPFSEHLIQKAESFPGVIAGIADPEELRESPSYRAFRTDNQYFLNDGRADSDENWPDEIRAILVLGLSHPETNLKLDWWDGKGTQGNRELMAVSKTLKEWIANNSSITPQELPYHVEKGGIFLKDAAVLAGMGVIGKNNLLVTPGFGPRVRLRAIYLDTAIFGTGPVKDFVPCKNCDIPCQRACPQNSFSSAGYRRKSCEIQMKKNFNDRVGADNSGDFKKSDFFVNYCRACEMACPVGKPG